MVEAPRQYKGWTIYPKNHLGMYQAWKAGNLHVRADTLAGLKELIRAADPKTKQGEEG